MNYGYLQAAAGGVLIGLAAWLLLAALGRVAGISGIVGGVLAAARGDAAWRWAFLGGLVLAGVPAAAWLQPPAPSAQPVPLLLVAGLLVGLGTTWGSGCTSGHGICGLARRSVRSLAATLVFMATGAAVVFGMALLRG